MMEKDAKIYVAGHRGMVGSAIVRELERQGYTNIVTRTHKSSPPKSRNTYSWPRRRWAASWPTRAPSRTSCTTTWSWR